MDFDCSGRNSQFMCRNLVGVTAYELFKHVKLAGRQQSQQSFSISDLYSLISRGSANCDCTLNAREQYLGVERLLDEVDGTRFHCLHGQRYVAMTRNDDHGQDDFASYDFFVE